jgi:gliding motility-associated-like protein
MKAADNLLVELCKAFFYFCFIVSFPSISVAQQFPGFINPGLEGVPGIGKAPPGWETCEGTSDILPDSLLAPFSPTQGKSFLGLVTMTTFPPAYIESVDQLLCEPLKKGVAYSFTADYTASLLCDSLKFDIYGGNSSCLKTELLASSPVITDSGTWKTATLHFIPTADYSYIVIRAYGLGWGYVCIDNIRPSTPDTSTISPDTSICTGDSIKLTASGGTSYLWSPGGQTTSSIMVSPQATTTYTLNITINCTTITKTVTVTVNSCSLKVTAVGGALCKDSCLVLHATGTGGKEPYTYLWQPGNLSGATPTVCPPATTIYTVTLTDQNGKTATDTAIVTTGISPVITATAASICAGEKAVLTASGATSYQWITPAGVLMGSTLTVSPAVTTTYTVIGTNKGCSDTTQTTVVVNPLPVIQLNNPVICSGVKTTVYAKGALSYTWLGSAGTILSTDSTLTITPTSTTSYTVVGTDNKGCKNTKVGYITVNPTPTVTTNGGVVCLGSEFKLEAKGNAITYVWTASDSSKLPDKALVIVVPITNTTYTVTGGMNYCLDTAIAHVNVNLPPVITVNNGKICEGKQFTLTASGATSYIWSTGATQNAITVSPQVTTSYLVTGIKNNCFQKITTTVTVNKKPKALFSVSPKELSEFEPTVLVTNSSIGNNLNYEWDFGDGASSALKVPTHTYSKPDSYKICLKATDSQTSCADSVCDNIVYKLQYTLYVPNAFTPDKDNLNEVFLAKGWDLVEFNMMIFDRWGNKIFESNDINNGWDGLINNQEATSGTYVWKINCRDVLKKEHQYIGQVTVVR